MVFRQSKEVSKIGKVIFIDASDQIRVGRAQNYLEYENISQIFDWLKEYSDVENYVKIASLEEIEENEYNLNIPLYVEKIIEDNLPSVEEALTNLKSAWNESQKAEEDFKRILNQFL